MNKFEFSNYRSKNAISEPNLIHLPIELEPILQGYLKAIQKIVAENFKHTRTLVYSFQGGPTF